MYQAIIGLECHAQLATSQKMFCACPSPTDTTAPNTTICPTCLAHPGTLPTLNAQAIALAIKAALTFGCTLHPTSIFARKNYFYPDLPKGYQISQYDRPLATHGTLHTLQGNFGITRIHIEEDAGQLYHEADGTYVNWNRAGVPLIEIVGEPDLKTPEQAEAWLRALHRVLTTAGICAGDLEKGNLRCDVNVSVHKPGEPWGTRVEIKNINSFRFVARAIKSEIDRQVKLLESGEKVQMETRTWTGTGTRLLRKKEVSADYRYFPEPDLPALVLEPQEVEQARQALPGVPMDAWLLAEDQKKKAAWVEKYQLSEYDIGVLQSEPLAAALFEATVALGAPPKAAANLISGEFLRRWNGDQSTDRVTPQHLVELIAAVENNTINRDAMKKLVDRLIEVGLPQVGQVAALINELGLQQLGSSDALRATVLEVVAKYPDEARRYRDGNAGLLGFFVGELMKATNRKADPKLSRQLLQEILASAG